MASKNFRVNGSVRRHAVVRRGTPVVLSYSSSGKSGGLSSRLEGPSSGRQAPDGGQAGVPGCFGAGRGRQVSPRKLPSGRPHHHAPVHDALTLFGPRSVDEVRPPPKLHGGFGGFGWSPPDRDPHSGVARHPRPLSGRRKIDLLEPEDEAEDKAEKDENYNPHQDQDDGVDDEDEIPDEASDDGVLNIAQRTTKRCRLSQPSAEVSTPKKVKTKSPVKTKVKVGSSGKSKSGSGSSKKPKPKSGGSRRQNSSTATVLAVKGPQHLDAEECRVIESPGLGITSWMSG
ncbi:unnamed protein product [Phytophthora fragariaefolia]|uniref:Unnamed protein product n=1 Tax=Phytophthora fragariaefolia TaxID=1490495 RepID=A0A9W6XEE5_9STRA|nr:unnamed protein product [Phytophthora fragariaefolia]